MKSLPRQLRQHRRQLLVVVILVIGLYIILPQIGDFRSSWRLLQHPRPLLVLSAIGVTGLTYLAAGATYCFLAFKPLAYRRVLLVQLAAMFINRLLPAGIGAIGTNYSYLRRSGHSPAQSASVVAVNNLLGFVGHVLILAMLLLGFSARSLQNLPDRQHWLGSAALIVLILAVILAVVALIFGRGGRGRLQKMITDTARQLLSYRQRPLHLSLALASSMALTICNIGVLICCAAALHVSLSFVAIAVVFTFGVGTGIATPTPGGLGGFEAGLVAGLVAYHVASPLALAVALLYRLVSYWLPLALGGLAFAAAQRRELF